jgi:hypothetical protein
MEIITFEYNRLFLAYPYKRTFDLSITLQKVVSALPIVAGRHLL